MLLAIFNCVYVPLSVAFDDEALYSSFFVITNWIIDFLFLIDILISFRTVFVDHRGRECNDDREMAVHYMQTTFTIDLLATIPFDFLFSFSESYVQYMNDVKTNGDIPWVQLLGLLKIGRLHRLSHIINFMKSEIQIKATL